mmetsp:Transcript_96116/g.256922  ORF Transcript_96116/g.256922 Transcript_96116/m.256922 type:complete len:204 (-) Transcript_96116:1347-1958(-)
MLLNVLVRPCHLHSLGHWSLHIRDHQLLPAQFQVLCKLFQGLAPRQIHVINREAINDNEVNLLPLPLTDLHGPHSKILHFPRIDEIQPRIHAHHHRCGQQGHSPPVVPDISEGPVPQHANDSHIGVGQLMHGFQDRKGEAHAEPLLHGEAEGHDESSDHHAALAPTGVVRLPELFEGNNPDSPLNNNRRQRRQRQVLYDRQED